MSNTVCAVQDFLPRAVPTVTGEVSTAPSRSLRRDAAFAAEIAPRLVPTTQTGTERVFSTPPLAQGQKYYYDVKAELTVSGKPVIEETRVILEAGASITHSFEKLIAAADNKNGILAGK